MGKKSLSDKILELSQPTTSFDIESHDLQEGHSDDSNRGSDDSESDDDHAREHYVSTGKSKLRNDGIQVGLKYGGKTSSRSDLYGDSDGEDAEERSESESRESDEGSEIDDDDQQGGSLEDDNLEDDVDEDDSGSVGENVSDEGSVSEGSEAESDELDGEFGRKYDKSKVKELLSREQKHLVGRMSQSVVNDALKGYAITHQNKLFDSILNLRMKVQKATTNANLLPVNSSIMQDYATKKSEDKIAGAEEACYDLLDALFGLRKNLMNKDSVASGEELKKVKNSKKRKLSDYMDVASSYDSLLEKYRSSVLTKWSAKIHNTSGSSAITAGKFKSINQSAEQQVRNNLTDMDRLVKKTKLNRRQIMPLGYESILANQATNEDDSEESDPDIPKQSNSDSKVRTAEIDEIFDDEDFYRTLLNDLIDKKIQSSNATSGLTIALKSLQLAQKMKKNVDTKASKGRKLRYNIQEPIANFEVPRGSWKWDDYQIDEFFASLLGHKINMNESESEPESSSDESEIVENGEDSIKLFG